MSLLQVTQSPPRRSRRPLGSAFSSCGSSDFSAAAATRSSHIHSSTEPTPRSSRILVKSMSSDHNTPHHPIRIGSRGSQLALWQANHILTALRDAGYHVELEVIRTTGDRLQHWSPESLLAGAEQ